MSAVQAAQPERGTSPLASNNPFRSRIGSGHTSPPLGTRTSKPISTNPFLDSSEVTAEPATNGTTSHSKPTMTENTTELFSTLTLNSKPLSPDRGSRPSTSGAPRRENMPPRPYGRFPPNMHRPSVSEEDRKRHQNKSQRPKGELDIFADPSESTQPRERRAPRRNSDGSVRERSSQLLDPEDEKRRRERKYRDAKKSGRSKPPSRKLDIIDRLDVTNIYGTGLFHHDGPFDACNPSRNRKTAKHAPMQAFPKDSENMRLGGSGPVNSHINLEQFHGRGQEAHIDYNEAAIVDEDAEYTRRPQAERNTSFNPMQREALHGSETIGLGTSTFLEGAPASRAAIQRRESENEAAQVVNISSMSRKKSLVQRIRSVRPNLPAARLNSPEPSENQMSPPATSKSENNANPFFKDYDQEHEKKGAQIAWAEENQKTGRMRAPSSPRRGLGLEKKMTNDSTTAEESKPSNGGGGLLSRVKSLKTVRRARVERRDTSG